MGVPLMIWTRELRSEMADGVESLAGKRVFITGGTGLFGKWLLSVLADSSAEVVVLTRSPDAFVCKNSQFLEHPRITFWQGDVRDFVFPSGHFDYIIHAATPVASDCENEDDLISIIVDGTRRVLEFAATCQADRVLYVSSGAVYGVQPPELTHISETFPCNPTTAYGQGKLSAENLCEESRVDVVIARCFAFVGPSIEQIKQFAIGNFIGNCLRNEPIEIKGDGTPLRSYMFASDLVDWLLAILLRGESGEVYNVGSDVAISISDLAIKVREVVSAHSPIEVRKPVVEGQCVERYIPSNRKAVEMLSLEMKVDLDNSIRMTASSWESSDS